MTMKPTTMAATITTITLTVTPTATAVLSFFPSTTNKYFHTDFPKVLLANQTAAH